MRFSVANSIAILGLLAETSTATSCTSSNATPVEQYINTSGGGGGGGVPIMFSEVYNVLSYAVKKRDTPDARLLNVGYVLNRRASGTVDCSSSEMCFSIQAVPFCLDITTGAFHDGDGTSGNALSGDYTLADGRKGNLYNGPHPLPSGQASVAATTAAGAGAGGSGATPAATAGSAASAGGAGSTPTETSKPAAATNGAASHGRMGAVLGGALIVGAGLL
ncbi:hypothetical protein QBC47DRAFT_460389 [Echria macrotheca]|uniref:Uncharacterized protein n=1 Tax=Echria macrotheca TaxID=438768 RepID=A0AAJ0BGX5_9PEZI|nr:hypothetical protein QBC47DRAFT_460389 [Echria macrotheca]